MYAPIFDNTGKQVATRSGMKVTSIDGRKTYDVDHSGNLLNNAGTIVGHLIPAGQYLPDGKPSPSESIF